MPGPAKPPNSPTYAPHITILTTEYEKASIQTKMSDDMKHDIQHIQNSDDGHGHVPKRLQTVTLTAEQFESLYLQPRDPRITGGLASRVGNPTPLYVLSSGGFN